MARHRRKIAKGLETGLRERLSREKGTIIKNWGGKIAIAIIYPNSYYLGMSNLGLHTVYSLFNRHNGIVCERFFWELENRERYTAPLSLESRRPLSDFSVLALSLIHI